MTTTTKKVLFCCGVALYIYALRWVLYDGGSLLTAPARPEAIGGVDTVESHSTRILVVTRVHMNAASALPDPEKVLSFIQSTAPYGDGVLICMGADDGTVIDSYRTKIEGLLQQHGLDKSKVHFLHISPWGYFTPALNYAVQFAQDHKYNRIAFQSLEVRVSAYEVQRVLRRLNVKNTIVVGPVLEGHEFIPGAEAKGVASSRKVELTGRTCPWNTFAIWRTHELGFLGFPLIGDGTGEDRSIGGVEELTAITMLQKINPKFTAVLLQVNPPTSTAQGKVNPLTSAGETSQSGDDKQALASWDTKFADPQRQLYHERKMASKVARPAAQLKVMGLAPGTVLHEVDAGV